VEWKLEVVVLPVSDVDRAKAFYGDRLGFTLDVDVRPSDSMRVVQFTPDGSGCSISFGEGMSSSAPGSVKGLQLTVGDIRAAHEELESRGVEMTPVRHLDNGVWKDGPGGPWNSFIFFDDPDGNSWAVQERPIESS
jgi:catechol 2,3-dioxygenase-like lactoylglutathione lyase family enzyme